MGKIVILMLDNLKKVDILQFLYRSVLELEKKAVEIIPKTEIFAFAKCIKRIQRLKLRT